MGKTRGRPSRFANMLIFKAVEGNPRRKKTGVGFLAFENVYDGMTYEEYIGKGGRSNDLAYDIKHNNLEVRHRIE